MGSSGDSYSQAEWEKACDLIDSFQWLEFFIVYIIIANYINEARTQSLIIGPKTSFQQ